MSDTADRPWLDASLPIEERIDLLVARMTLDELVGQCVQAVNVDVDADAADIAAGRISSSLAASGPHAGNVRDAGVAAGLAEAVQRIAVEQSRLGIPLLLGRDVIHGHRTVFPVPLGQGAGFDEDLVAEAARIAAGEASADGIRWSFAPMLDICDDPRWGRIAEGYGEAPELTGRLGAAAVRGFQGDTPAQGIPRGHLVATAKHFVGYGLAGGGRDYETVQVGENTLRNVHLRPFRAAVDAGVQTVMAAFNDIDGVPMHMNRHLLRDVLKQEWGFDGLVVGDWAGVGELQAHGVAGDEREAARLAMTGGVDLEMASEAYRHHLRDLVASGEVPHEVLVDSVRRVLRVKFRAGLFERPWPEGDGRPADPTPRTREVARRAAIASMVLVQNRPVAPVAAGGAGLPGGPNARPLLPLDPEGLRVHLTGPFVDEGEALLGTWVLDGRGDDVVPPASVLRERLGERLEVTDGRFSDLAAQASRRCDVTVMLLGEHPARSGEANSVSNIGLPAGQLETLRQQSRLGRPVVAVVYTGRPLDLTEVLEAADAVLVCFHPGVEAGPALDAVLFGDAEPGGRLPASFPRSSGHVPNSHLARRTSRPIDPVDDARTGRYLDALTQPLLPFGAGMGYTTFQLGTPRLSASEVERGGEVRLHVEVANTGARRGRALVQVYLSDPVAELTRPRYELLDWQWVDADAGTTVGVDFVLTSDRFGYHGLDHTFRVDAGAIGLSVGLDSAHLQQVGLTVR